MKGRKPKEPSEPTKIREVRKQNKITAYWLECPGCLTVHIYNAKKWRLSGTSKEPTLDPSLIINNGKERCHSWVRRGRIMFFNDSTHELRDHTVTLPNIEDGCGT